MRCKAPDKTFYAELNELNAEFLILITGETGFCGTGVFGLNSAVRSQLQRLSSSERAFIAGTPMLLAGFVAPPPGSVVEDESPVSAVARNDSPVSAVTFCAGLMTYLWQMSRRDPLNAAFCIGMATHDIERFASLSFREIQSSTLWAVRRLQARFCEHPRFWADLIRAARSGEGPAQRTFRLSGIPIALAGHRPVADHRRRKPARNGY